ncbi:MAG: hypothetical protein ACR2ND_12660 [Solirubrobacteraceae bacterium]
MFWRTQTDRAPRSGAVQRALGVARALVLLEDEQVTRDSVEHRGPHPHRQPPALRIRARRRGGSVSPRPQVCISPVAPQRACLPDRPARRTLIGLGGSGHTA